MKKVYKAREGAPFQKEEVVIIGQALEDIEKKEGKITPQSFIDVSKAKSSPTHHLFEWDTTRAAEQYRLHQARDIINHVDVIVISEQHEPIQIRAYPSVVIEKERGYLSSEAVVKVEDYAKQVIERLISQIEGRQQELIIGKSSKLVTLTAVSLVCGKLSNIDQFKFYQRAIGQIVFHYVKIDPDVKIDEKQIIQSLQYILGDDFEITTQEVKKIPLTITGKLCYLDQQLEINEFIQ